MEKAKQKPTYSHVEQIRKLVLQLNKEIEQKITSVDHLLHALQQECPHELKDIVEQNSAGRGGGPGRLCKNCGLYESGFINELTTRMPVPYDKLKHVPKLPFMEVMKLRSEVLGRTRVGIDQDDKPPRKEKHK